VAPGTTGIGGNTPIMVTRENGSVDHVSSAKTASTSSDKGSQTSTGTDALVTMGIVGGIVVVLSAVGIFIFRKWKLSPSNGDQKRWKAPDDEMWNHLGMEENGRKKENDAAFLRQIR